MQGQRGDRVGRTSTTHEKAQAAAVAPTNARELERVSEIDALIVFDGWRETATGGEGERAFARTINTVGRGERESSCSSSSRRSNMKKRRSSRARASHSSGRQQNRKESNTHTGTGRRPTGLNRSSPPPALSRQQIQLSESACVVAKIRDRLANMDRSYGARLSPSLALSCRSIRFAIRSMVLSVGRALER